MVRKVVDYSKLRIFGCLAYAHVKQDKLDLRALKCILLEYLAVLKAISYGVLNLNYHSS